MLDQINDVVTTLHPRSYLPELPPPGYTLRVGRPELALAVASMKDHVTDEGWQIMHGLSLAGYKLCGHALPNPSTDVLDLIKHFDPGTVLLQDKREWDTQIGNFRDPASRFTNVEALAVRPDIFKLTILKDSHQRPQYHMESAQEIGCHAWVTYYHPKIVKKLAPYVREQHLVRTYHTIDPREVPPYSSKNRNGCLLSGAMSSAYPLRQLLFKNYALLPTTTALKHPGYGRNGCKTPAFLQTLSRFKVAVCTASIYGYSLRKLMEATSSGCVVITNLPEDDVLPEIDGNLVRVPSNISVTEIAEVIRKAINDYDPEKQSHFAKLALTRYAYPTETKRLASAIWKLRSKYSAERVPQL